MSKDKIKEEIQTLTNELKIMVFTKEHTQEYREGKLKLHNLHIKWFKEFIDR